MQGWVDLESYHWYRVSKNVPTYFLLCVKYEQIKIGVHVLEGTLNERMQNVPISSKIGVNTTLGYLKWWIEPSRQYLLYVHFNESPNSQKTHWQYSCLNSKIVKRLVSHTVFTSYARNVCLQHERKHVHVELTWVVVTSHDSLSAKDGYLFEKYLGMQCCGRESNPRLKVARTVS